MLIIDEAKTRNNQSEAAYMALSPTLDKEPRLFPLCTRVSSSEDSKKYPHPSRIVAWRMHLGPVAVEQIPQISATVHAT